MSTTVQVSKINKRIKDCVYGWIREMEDNLNLNIPMTIKQICIIYFPANICPNGNKMTIMDARVRGQPRALKASKKFATYTIECDICKYRFKNFYFVKQVAVCQCNKCKRKGGYDQCFPFCLYPHQNGKTVRTLGANCDCKRCR